MHAHPIAMNYPSPRTTASVAAFCAVMLGFNPPAVHAVPLKADSKITAVTVYTDRAVVTRTAALDLATSGVFEVNFEKLPGSLNRGIDHGVRPGCRAGDDS